MLILSLSSIAAYAQISGAMVTHIYNLNSSTADELGGPAIVLPDPGGLGPTGYSFDADEGPNLSNAINANEYSIEIVFRIDDISNFKKIIDFKNRLSDTGLYNINS